MKNNVKASKVGFVGAWCICNALSFSIFSCRLR